MDKAHMMTDDILESLEKRLAREYRKANTEVEKKLRAYLDKFAADDAAQRKLLNAGKITEKDYQDWRFRHMMMNKRWQDLRDTLAEDLHNANVIARDIYRGERPEIYSLNHNYAVYQIEHDAGIDTGLTLYNRDAVNRMLTQDPQMLPPPGKKVSKRIAEGKDVRWNNRQIQSVMTQGILQGDSIPELARRLEEVTERNYTAAVRNARTMATGAQNAGRMDAYQRAAKKGVHLVQEWVAVLDMRTRHDHRLLHGVRIPIDEEWETEQGKIRFPGDPTGPPSEIYNCRCTTVSWVQGFEGETIRESPGMEGLTFEEWVEDNAPKRKEPTETPKPSAYNATRIDHQIAETPPLNEYEYWSEEEDRKRFNAIKAQTGFDDEKAEMTLHAFSGNRNDYHGLEDTPEGWFYRADRRIRKLDGEKWADAAKTIDEYIEAAPKYDGPIYRGMSLSDDKIAAFQKGGIFQDNGSLSSWTSSLDVANMFAEGRTEEYGLNPVIIETIGHPHSSPVAHLSLFGSEEDEVLVSNLHGNEYTIDSIEKRGGVLFVRLIFGG